MRRAVLMSVVALALAAPQVRAQAHPSFAGNWAMVMDPDAAPPGGGRGAGRAGLGMSARIGQSDKQLTITRTTPNGEVNMVYNLDGTDSKNMMNGRGGQMELLSHARWDGTKLVITTSMNMGGTAVETSMALSFDGSGNLTVENTRPSMGGGAPMTMKTTYKKS